MEVSRQIIGMCRERGFALAGVARANPTRYRDELIAWLAAGKHGSMGYLAEHVAARLDPGLVLAGARSVVMVADRYAPRGDEDQRRPGWGRVARYARGRDYHDVMKKRLHALADELRARFGGEEFRAFVDTAPVLEREYAARAGLGWIGRNTLVIHPRVGSYVLLGGLFTTMNLEPPAEQAVLADHCGTCTRCVDACPTGAIAAGDARSVDATRCISYLTIERRPPIAPEFYGRMGDWLYGCDVCQEVCPHNSAREWGADPVRGEYAPARRGFDLLEVLGWREEDRRREFAGSALRRATLAMMKRNAVIVAGNELARGVDEGLRARLKGIAVDQTEDPMVRDTAAEVLRGIAPCTDLKGGRSPG